VNIGVHLKSPSGMACAPCQWCDSAVRAGRLRSPAELKQWVERAGTPMGWLKISTNSEGRCTAEGKCAGHARPAALDALMRLLGDPDTELTVRIGINAVFEGMEGKLALQRTVPELIALSAHRDAISAAPPHIFYH